MTLGMLTARGGGIVRDTLREVSRSRQATTADPPRRSPTIVHLESRIERYAELVDRV